MNSVARMSRAFSHEEIHIRRAARTGLPVVVALHSTALGPALGGCRVRRYADWRDGLADALRLSEAMTYKCALAGLPHGGGKTVVALPGDGAPDRRALLHDVGDVVESLGGRYATGPDVGTGSDDMVTIRDRTKHVFCRPAWHGGSGDSSPHTAVGVMAAIRATCRHLFGSPDLSARRVALVGLGHVGTHLARDLAAAGAELLAADVDPARRAVADEVGAEWVDPDRVLTAPVDVLVPAALGGVLTHDLVPRLSCAAVVGPANNQLAEDTVADALHAGGVLWVPDYVASAGGVIFAITSELHGLPPAAAEDRVHAVGDAVTEVLLAAQQDGVAPHRAASRRARERVSAVRHAAETYSPVT